MAPAPVSGTCVDVCKSDPTTIKPEEATTPKATDSTRAASTTARTTTTSELRVTTRLTFNLDAAGLSDVRLEQEVRELLEQAGVNSADIFSVRILRGSIIVVLLTTKTAATLIGQAARTGTLMLRGAPAAVQGSSGESEGETQGDDPSSALAIYAGAGVGTFVLVLIVVLLVVRRRSKPSRRVVAVAQPANNPREKGLFLMNPVYAASNHTQTAGVYLPSEDDA